MTRNLLVVACLAVGMAACGGSNASPTPIAPTPAPTPTPAPSPSPTPTVPTPVPSFNAFVRMHNNAECPQGKSGHRDGALPVGCAVEVRVSYHYPDGKEAPKKVTGENTLWAIDEGAAFIDMPIVDENPWRRWVTAKTPGAYRVSVTIVSRRGGETVRGELANRVVP